MFDPSAAPEDDVLARTIVGEARNQGDIGMQAVACVVLNRTKRPGWWGNDIKTVCLHPGQFSCWNHGDPNRAIIENLSPAYTIYNEALDIARKVISGDLPDITNGALNYKVVRTPAKWAEGHSPCAVIKQHEFYNDIDNGIV